MSEYTEVEQPFLEQLSSVGWTIIDQGREIPKDPSKSLRRTFRQLILPDVFAKPVSAVNTTSAGEAWLTEKQFHDLHDQILRQPNRTLLEANEAIQKLLFKAQGRHLAFRKSYHLIAKEERMEVFNRSNSKNTGQLSILTSWMLISPNNSSTKNLSIQISEVPAGSEQPIHNHEPERCYYIIKR